MDVGALTARAADAACMDVGALTARAVDAACLDVAAPRALTARDLTGMATDAGTEAGPCNTTAYRLTREIHATNSGRRALSLAK